MSIVIEDDHLYEEAEFVPADLETLSREEIIGRVKEAGIVGMGGAGFPTHVKLSPKNPDSITDVIVNCAECEPYLTSDYRRMMEEPEKLIAGLKVMLKLFPNAKGTLAVEDNKPDAIALLKKLTKDETDISVAALHTKYPQGSERHLIYAVTGRAINSSMLPADAGCIVDNVDTVVAINQAVREGKPLMHRIVTVTGDAVANPQNFIVRIGTNYNELIEEAGGFVQEPAKIISGGPMMGFGIFDLNVPTTKTSSALLCLTHDDVADSQPSACINCGRCVEVCPGRVVPKLLADYAERHDLEDSKPVTVWNAANADAAATVCPAKRPLHRRSNPRERWFWLKKEKTAGGEEMSDLRNVSSNPHIRAKDTTSRIMLTVVIALLLPAFFGIYNFGFRALVLILISIATCVLTEYIYEKLMKKPITIGDFSAVVTGLLLALNLPVSVPFWIPVVGGVFAILVVKMLFGGLGQNFMNPALAGRCFLLISFTSLMTNFNCDAYTGATPLASLKAGESVNVLNMILGRTAGTIGADLRDRDRFGRLCSDRCRCNRPARTG